jgi:response regulator RpfG family c-di-GMP phosphodiesterase
MDIPRRARDEFERFLCRPRPSVTKSSRTMNGIVGTVFVVDDVEDVRTAVARLLTTADYRVRLFESAEHFLAGRDGTGRDRAAPGCLLLDMAYQA